MDGFKEVGVGGMGGLGTGTKVGAKGGGFVPGLTTVIVGGRIEILFPVTVVGVGIGIGDAGAIRGDAVISTIFRPC